MASFGHYPSFPNQYPPPSQQPPPPPGPARYPPTTSTSATSGFLHSQNNYAPPPTSHHYSSYPPPPPVPMYPPPHQPPPYFQNSQFPPPLPPPTSSSSSIPPPPPPSSPPPPPPPSHTNDQLSRPPNHNALRGPGQGHLKPPMPGNKRSETEDERLLRKKKEMEKLRQDCKLKEPHKTHNAILSSNGSKVASVFASRLPDNPLLTSDRGDNRLKKPTTFLCKMKFRNELPDASSQIKLTTLPKDSDRFTKYSITTLEKTFKPELHVDGDLGIHLDLLDLSIYNPPKNQIPMEIEDEELLRDDEEVTPVKLDGIRKKERPTDKGLSWLVKT